MFVAAILGLAIGPVDRMARITALRPAVATSMYTAAPSSGATVTVSAERAAAVANRLRTCRMSTPSRACHSDERGPSGETELAVRVASAGAKGMGAFAAEAAQPGRWIGSYQGPLISLDEQRDLYHETDPEYLFQITPDVYIDGNLSKHFTRFFNHDQRGNLNFTVSVDPPRVDFFAAAAIAPGSELCFDYGVGYWLGSAASPAHGSDSRNFSLAAAAPPLPGPPPLTPRTALQLQVALQLPPPEARAALLRCLEFFGSVRVSAGEVDIPLRLPAEANAERETGAEKTPSRARVDPASCSLTTLEAAASSCVDELVRRHARREGGT